jgi:hypothetical protein
MNTQDINENYRTLENGEIVQKGDLVGQIENWERNWYPVGPALVGNPCTPEYWIKRLRD